MVTQEIETGEGKGRASRDQEDVRHEFTNPGTCDGFMLSICLLCPCQRKETAMNRVASGKHLCSLNDKHQNNE